MKEWEREQALERTQSMFRFFFQHPSNEREENGNGDASHDRFFSSFSRIRKTTNEQEQSQFEDQFKEYQGRNFDHLNDFVNQQSQKRFHEPQRKRRTQHQNRHDHDKQHQHNEFRFHRSQRVHKRFEQNHPGVHFQNTESFESRQYQGGPQQERSTNHQNFDQKRRQRAGPDQEFRYDPNKRASSQDCFKHPRKGRETASNPNQASKNGQNQQHQPTSDEKKSTFKDTKYMHPQQTPKKKAKVKSQFKKKAKVDKEMAKRYTKGTDGKWYFKGEDGRWKEHNGPPNFKKSGKKKSPKPTKTKAQFKTQPQEEQRNQDQNRDQKSQNSGENTNKYVRDKDGNWYVKVDPPPGAWSSKTEDKFYQKQQHKQENKFGHRLTQKPYSANNQWDSATSNEPRRDERFNQQQKETTHHQSASDSWQNGARYGGQRAHQFGESSRRFGADSYRSNTRQSEEPTQKARQNSQNLPRGLFMRQDGEVVDRLGNVYDRISGHFRVRQSARTSKYRNRQTISQNLHQKEHSHKQQQNQPNQKLFRDMSGNVYIKDENGNLIKVQPQKTEEAYFRQTHFSQNNENPSGTRDSYAHGRQQETNQERPRDRQTDRHWPDQQTPKYKRERAYHRPTHEEL